MNYLQKLLVVALLAAAPLLHAAGPASPTLGHPIHGTWSWVTFGGSCTEAWQFRPNKTLLSTSGEQVTQKTYDIAVTPDTQGFFKVVETVIRHNDKKDCAGALSEEPGERTTRFIQFSPRGDQLLVCQAAALTACFGPLKRAP